MTDPFLICISLFPSFSIYVSLSLSIFLSISFSPSLFFSIFFSLSLSLPLYRPFSHHFFLSSLSRYILKLSKELVSPISFNFTREIFQFPLFLILFFKDYLYIICNFFYFSFSGLVIDASAVRSFRYLK